MLASLRNLLLITVWISVFGIVLFLGCFFRAYHAFTIEEPVAEVFTQSLDAALNSKMSLPRYLFIKGDQWMIEGDFLKWKSCLNFFGLHTSYRLTRIGGRHLSTEAEVNQPHTVYSFVEPEDDLLWRYLYEYGPQLPFVSTIYGNAAFHTSGKDKRYLIYIGTSGFIVRERQEQ